MFTVKLETGYLTRRFESSHWKCILTVQRFFTFITFLIESARCLEIRKILVIILHLLPFWASSRTIIVEQHFGYSAHFRKSFSCVVTPLIL